MKLLDVRHRGVDHWKVVWVLKTPHEYRTMPSNSSEDTPFSVDVGHQFPVASRHANDEEDYFSSATKLYTTLLHHSSRR